jgi:hypothetical protein
MRWLGIRVGAIIEAWARLFPCRHHARRKPMIFRISLLGSALVLASCASAPGGHHADHGPDAGDSRVAVEIPEPMRTHMLANMRDHLLAIQEIQQALSVGAFDRASQVAESRLGMTALKSHGAHDMAKFMPEGMQATGTQMHRSASRLAVEAVNAGATGDVRPALGALAAVTAQCVACHAGFRMK